MQIVNSFMVYHKNRWFEMNQTYNNSWFLKTGEGWVLISDKRANELIEAGLNKIEEAVVV